MLALLVAAVFSACGSSEPTELAEADLSAKEVCSTINAFGWALPAVGPESTGLLAGLATYERYVEWLEVATTDDADARRVLDLERDYRVGQVSRWVENPEEAGDRTEADRQAFDEAGGVFLDVCFSAGLVDTGDVYTDLVAAYLES